METPRRSARIQKKTQISLENGRGFSLVQNTVYDHSPYFKAYLFLLESFIPIVSWALSVIIYSSMSIIKHAKIIGFVLMLFSIQYYSFRNYSMDKPLINSSRELNLKLEYLEEKVENMTMLLNYIQNNSEHNMLKLENDLKQVSKEIKGKITEINHVDKQEILDLISKTCQKDYMINYALKSRGSKILDSSQDYLESFHSKWMKIMLPGVKRKSKNKVMSLLESKRNPGDCWAMKGSKGFVNIGLSERIIPDLMVIHHAPIAEISDFKSAPRKIQIFSQNNLLSQGIFDPNNDTSSVFKLEKVSGPIGSLRLEILSNWGNSAYTCIYNVQVFSAKSKVA